MSVCCAHAVSAGKIYSRLARLHRWQRNKKGLGVAQKSLLQGLEQLGFKESTLLEIGCGVGHLHQTLLERGAGSALGVDLAKDMLREAEDWARQRGLAEKTRYIEGDFVNLAASVVPADITLLDKVVCCYPDAELLVNSSLAKTNRLYALVYPRDRWYTHMVIGFAALLMRMIRSDFRPYVHDPVRIEAWIAARGFKKRYETNTLMTLTQIFEYQ